MYSCKSIKISFIYFFYFLFDLYTDIFDFTLIKQNKVEMIWMFRYPMQHKYVFIEITD